MQLLPVVAVGALYGVAKLLQSRKLQLTSQHTVPDGPNNLNNKTDIQSKDDNLESKDHPKDQLVTSSIEQSLHLASKKSKSVRKAEKIALKQEERDLENYDTLKERPKAALDEKAMLRVLKEAERSGRPAQSKNAMQYQALIGFLMKVTQRGISEINETSYRLTENNKKALSASERNAPAINLSTFLEMMEPNQFLLNDHSIDYEAAPEVRLNESLEISSVSARSESE